MTKKNTKVLIPAGAQVADVVEAEDTTPKTVDMQALVAMGVDMKLSKNDIIEYAAEMMAEQLQKELTDSKAVVTDFTASFMAELRKRRNAVRNDPQFKEVAKVMESLERVASVGKGYFSEERFIFVVTVDGSSKILPFYEDSLLNGNNCYWDRDTNQPLAVGVSVVYSYAGFTSNNSVQVMTSDEVSSYREALKSAYQRYNDAREAYHKLDFASKKVKLELTKAILQNSDKGRELLSFLDSSSKTRLKALASKNA